MATVLGGGLVGATADALAAWRAVRTRVLGPDAAHRRALARYHRRVGRLRTRVFASVVAFVATAVAAWPGGPDSWWLCGTALAGWFGVTGWLALRRAVPPVRDSWGFSAAGLPARAAAVWTRSIPTSDVGRRLAVVQTQLARLLPVVRRLHPPAAGELAAAVKEAAPLLNAQLDRLGVLEALAADMAGTPAAESASRAAVVVAGRVDAGVSAYERLLAAAAELLAAPDLDRSAAQVLAPAVQAMQAYSHGLVAATTSRDVSSV
jgi:hypothetical protein